ncbi:PKD-like family lipoprotein [Sphingobacterium griseoflavum]|uniref:PKD-like family protein n=1 Tax=Sphingobacterium griseoflavum TaxID=1474952 RepID=A0ABQ3HXR3_9SPHI|nr:PKD-like family lipoprotein [Sphingobacterium griseoflavum]GHE29875.1 hypothetical protein GCM10017764_11160 [Sphingobacterium griseoflavum]
MAFLFSRTIAESKGSSFSLTRPSALLNQWKLLLLSLALVLSHSSCYKDLGNYDYTTLNEFSLSGLIDSRVIIGDTLRLNTVLTEASPDSLRLDYLWTVELTESQRSAIGHDSVALVIGRQKKLEYFVDSIPAGNYTVKVEARDRHTGIRQFTTAALSIFSRYQRGYMLLEETAQGGDISLVNDSTVYRHLFSENNEGMRLPLPLYGIFTANTMLNNYNTKILFVSAGDFHRELDEQTFRVVQDVNNLVPSGFSRPIRPVYLEALRRRTIYSTFIWNNGYISKVLTGSTNRLIAFYYPPLIADYELAPFLGHFFSTGYLGYDQKNGRFLKFMELYVFELEEFGDAEADDAFDFNAINKEMVYGSNVSQNNEFVGVFKDNNQNFHLYRIDFRNFDIVAHSTYQINLAAVPEINRASAFAASYNLPLLYYTVDNKVYLFDIPNQEARAFYEFPAGENITTIEWANKEGVREIAISTYDGNQGRFYVFVPNASGTFTATRWPVQGGFGKIVKTHMKFNVDSPRD